MKHFSTLKFIVICLMTNFLFLASCSDESISDLEPGAELNGYFKSERFLQLKENFGITESNLDLRNKEIQEQNDANVNIFYIPVTEDGKKIGLLAVFSKNKGEVYRSIYQDISETLTSDQGQIYLYTAYKSQIGSFSYKKQDDSKLYSLEINKVNRSASVPRLKNEAEWPTGDESWLDCTSMCYDYATEACDTDAGCQTLCDLIDAVTLANCTLSLIAACAYHCI